MKSKKMTLEVGVERNKEHESKDAAASSVTRVSDNYRAVHLFGCPGSFLIISSIFRAFYLVSRRPRPMLVSVHTHYSPRVVLIHLFYFEQINFA